MKKNLLVMIIILAGVIPSSSQIITTDNYVSTLDIHKPDIDDEFYERYIDELLLLDFMEMLKQTKPVRQTSYSHYEAPQLRSYVNANGTQTVATPGNPMTITLQHDNHLNSGKSSYPRVNDLVHFKNYVVGLIYSKDVSVDFAHTITVYPVQQTDAIGTVTAGDSVTIISNAWPAGSGGNTGKTWTAIKYTNTCQITKEMFEAEGSEMTNQIWFEVPNADGTTGYVWTYEGEKNTFREMRLSMELNLIITPPVTSTFLLAAGYRTSEAMIPYIQNQGGIQYNYTQGQFTLAEHKKMLKLLDKGGTYANEYAFIQGIDLYDEYETFIMNTMQNGAISYGGFQGGETMAIKLGFRSISTLGYTFHLKRYRLFNNQNILGAPGFDYPGLGICMPMKTMVHPKTGKPVPYFRLRNKEMAGYNRGMEHWVLGGAGGSSKGYTSAVDTKQTHYRAENSVEFFAAPQWIVVKRS
jgi:hypothetical protein